MKWLERLGWSVLAVGMLWIGGRFVANSIGVRKHDLVGTRIPYQGRTLVVWAAYEYREGTYCIDATWSEDMETVRLNP